MSTYPAGLRKNGTGAQFARAFYSKKCRMSQNRAEGWTKYAADELTTVNVCGIEFAKRISGFNTLEMNEQIRLVKKRIFVVSMISISQCYTSDAGLVSILRGLSLHDSTFNCSERQFAHSIISGIQTLAAMQLTNTEMTLFASFAPLQNSPQSQTHVEQINTALIWQLSHRLCPCHACVEYARLTSDILPLFDMLSMQHVECVARLQSLDPTTLKQR